MSLRDLLAFFGAAKPPKLQTLPMGVQRLPVKTKYVGWRRLKVYEIEPIVAEHDTLYLGCYLQLTTDRVLDFEDGLMAYMVDCMEGKVVA